MQYALLAILTAANLLFLVLLYAAQTLVAERCWFAALITYVPQHVFGIPAVGLLIASAASRRWRCASINAAALLLFLAAMMGFNIPTRARSAADGPVLRVMTVNIHHASRQLPRIAAEIKASRADIVCLQEANSEGGGPDPGRALERLLPGWDCVYSGELAVFSRFRILDREVYWRPGFLRPFLRARISARGMKLNVAVAHLATALGGQSLSRHQGSLPDYIDGAARIRSKQVSDLMAYTRSLPGPVVVAGDFNTPPRGLLYRRMSSRFADSFRRAGWGFGYTYRSDLPVMRIDYIWAGEGMAPISAETLSISGSDHKAVTADLAYVK